MKNKLIIVFVVVGIVFLSGISLSAENPSVNNYNVRNRAGSGAVPPSSYSNSLYRNANQIDRSSNDVITGNIGGGKHFRGSVPYNTETNFGGSLGSTSLDSFLRRYGGIRNYGNYTGKTNSYYSSSGTVTGTRAGSSGIYRPSSFRVEGGATGRTYQWSDTHRTDVPRAEVGVSSLRINPMSLTKKELEEVISTELSKYPMTQKVMEPAQQARLERLRKDLKKAGERATELRESLTEEKELWDKFDSRTRSEKAKQIETESKRKALGEYETVDEFGLPIEDIKTVDIYEKMKRQVDSSEKDSGQYQTNQLLKRYGYERKEKKRRVDIGTEFQRQPAGDLQEEKAAEAEETIDESSEIDVLSKPYQSFASFSQDRFNLLMKIAEEYLKNGKYYQASNTYILASVYKPDDPLVYAGQCHALFAAGEYISSASNLSHALEIFPEYAKVKIDIVAIIGDRDTIETRIEEVEQLLELREVAQLRFLLGYVYLHMSRVDKAKEMINQAVEQLPQAKAIKSLKEAIDSADTK